MTIFCPFLNADFPVISPLKEMGGPTALDLVHI